MESNNAHPAWMDDELIKNIPQKKLEFAASLFTNGHGKSQKELMAFIMPMMKRAKAENLTFTQQELTACIQAIKKHATREELEHMESILQKNKAES